MLVSSTLFAISVSFASASPYNRTVNLGLLFSVFRVPIVTDKYVERIPPAYADIIPNYSINHCSENQTEALSVAIKNAWTDAVRAFVDLDTTLPSPAFTTFFKTASSIGNVSKVFDDIVEKRGAPQVPDFHCVSGKLC